MISHHGLSSAQIFASCNLGQAQPMVLVNNEKIKIYSLPERELSSSHTHSWVCFDCLLAMAHMIVVINHSLTHGWPLCKIDNCHPQLLNSVNTLSSQSRDYWLLNFHKIKCWGYLLLKWNDITTNQIPHYPTLLSDYGH